MGPKFLCALILTAKAPERLAAFYRDVLGLPLERREDPAGAFSCMIGSTHFAIHGAKEGEVSGEGLRGNTELGLHFSNLEEFVKGLNARGIEIVDPIREYPWAKSAQIRDPEGNL